MTILNNRQWFVSQDALQLAQSLIGTIIVRQIGQETIMVRIVETEAYTGVTDPASHAYQGRRTKRTEPMYLAGGYLYVYLIYGLNCCLNVIAGSENDPQAVLIRAVEPISGWELIKQFRSHVKQLKNYTNGPGKLCQALQVDCKFSGYDLTRPNPVIYLMTDALTSKYQQKIKTSPRININYTPLATQTKPYRFYVDDNQYISKLKN